MEVVTPATNYQARDPRVPMGTTRTAASKYIGSRGRSWNDLVDLEEPDIVEMEIVTLEQTAELPVIPTKKKARGLHAFLALITR